MMTVTPPFEHLLAAHQVRANRVALGWVRAHTIRARHLGKDILARLKSLVGGEISEYTKWMAESREQALDRMRQEDYQQGANVVVGVRFTTQTDGSVRGL